MDDYVKPRRGTAPSVYGTSSLSHTTTQRRRFRRQHDPTLDGPLFLEHVADGTSTRVKEIAALIRSQGDSGLGPGEYDGLLNKDRVMRSAPAVRVGTADREGRSQHAKSLSISRSIQHGIDWHVPVIVTPAPTAGAGAGAMAAGGSAPAGEVDAAATAAPRAEQPSALARNHSVSGSVGGGGGGSRDTSPSGRPTAAEQYLGAPPAPPSQVSRAVRRQQERRPGDWDWNRLNKNYRTTWTTLHGGAYTHGEHPVSKPPYAGGPGGGGAAGGGGSGPLGGMGGSHSSPAMEPHAVAQGIYPIAEESSGALEANSSMGSMQQQYHAQQQQQYQQHQYHYQQQQQQQQYHVPPGDGGGGAGGPSGQPADGYPEQGAAGGGWEAGDGYGGGMSLPGGLPPVGMSGPASMSLKQPGQKIKSLISEEDLRRRRAAIALAQQAQQANNRVTDWQSKFAG
eukprot:XP_001702664.1 predicted protein [Chlamydomonas reinhardtii]